ncbi:M15 family metallopeptidase [Paraglaciecola arctica]|uniref:M15 family metallopeptidase n=1 Tax=Paraglaciecola arctica TaxID=1128911 RepID=UPI001C07CA59|nr:M15 family metallopeptidase [Paraglaciecola arctica]
MITQAHALGKDESLLVECQNGFRLLPEVCVAFKRMQTAATQDKVDLQIVSSYRGFQRQLQIWNNKWSGNTTLLDANENTLNAATLTDLEKLQAILTWSALPGASRHHWGTDIDVYDKKSVEISQHKFQLVCSEYDNGPCTELNNWLNQHANDFGFSRPFAKFKGGIAREPWHLSFTSSAEKMSTLVDETTLLNNLYESDIMGLQSIVDNMPTIFQRFVLNKGLV